MPKKYLNELCEIISHLQTPQEVHSFLKGILTPKELEDIPTRLQIVKLLKQGVSQREIAAQLGVGIATVTRGAKELKSGRFQAVKT
ncbi:MAG: helix-turn-helix domain-containing protein [Bdellovibrionales bacterium]|nr:helix-turn-helix domain-containing protein [Bdellovibrionales bacterium]